MEPTTFPFPDVPPWPSRFTVTAFFVGSLFAICASRWMGSDLDSAVAHIFFSFSILIVLGPFFALAWLAGIWSVSPAGRLFCIVWSILAAYLFITASLAMDLAAARGGIRCGNTLMGALLWIVFVPPVALFIAYCGARCRKDDAAISDDGPE